MTDRPDYIPTAWIDSRWNRPFERNPRLVVVWFVVGFIVAVVGATLFLAAGSWLGYAPAIGAIGLGVQGAIYVPRAVRAARQQRHEQPGH